MSQPTLIAFDTSMAHCAAALMHNGTLTTRIDPMAKGQAEHLMPMLEEMLADAGITWQDLDAIGVGIGPGNFTGIRISVSAARGLALGLNIPAVGVSTLDAQIWGVEAGNTISCHDARREMIYLQQGRDASTAQLCEMRADTLARFAKPSTTVVGNKAEELATLMGWHAAMSNAPIVEGIAHLTAERFHRAELARPAPLYLRSADAAPPRDAAPIILS
jgi:tRNA threonylcarbamoyl adenosine modification protein YeaZ